MDMDNLTPMTSLTGQSGGMGYGSSNTGSGYTPYGATGSGSRSPKDLRGLKVLGSILTILFAGVLAMVLYIVITQCQQASSCSHVRLGPTSTQATLLDRMPTAQTVASRIKGMGRKLAGVGAPPQQVPLGHLVTSSPPGAGGAGAHGHGYALGPSNVFGGVLATGPAGPTAAMAGPAAAAGPFPMPNRMALSTGVAAAQTVAAASQQYAAAVHSGGQAQGAGGGQQASGADVQRVADTLAGVNGASTLGSVIQQFDGPYLAYEQKTTMQPLAGVDEPWNDSTKLLEFLDPKGAAQLAAALSLSATPGRFFASDTDARRIQAEQRAKYWRRNGKLDLTPEEILDDRPVWVPTAAAIRQAVLGDGVDRTIASSFPRRFAYPDMAGGRMATPRVVFTKDSVIQEPMLPGYDVQLSSQACNTCLKQTMEPL